MSNPGAQFPGTFHGPAYQLSRSRCALQLGRHLQLHHRPPNGYLRSDQAEALENAVLLKQEAVCFWGQSRLRQNFLKSLPAQVSALARPGPPPLDEIQQWRQLINGIVKNRQRESPRLACGEFVTGLSSKRGRNSPFGGENNPRHSRRIVAEYPSGYKTGNWLRNRPHQARIRSSEAVLEFRLTRLFQHHIPASLTKRVSGTVVSPTGSPGGETRATRLVSAP